MTDYRLVSEPRADLDIEAAFHWYEKEQPGLGLEFLDELRKQTGAFPAIINRDPTPLDSLADFNYRGAIGEFVKSLSPL